MKALFFIEIPMQPHSEESVYHWYKKDLENDSYGCDDLTEIKNKSLNCEVVLILPGLNVSQKQIASKIKNRKKLELAIAYELEEQLSEEIDQLFFAYQPAKEKNIFDVTVINRAWFESWLEIFKQQGIPLVAVITDTFLLETLPQEHLLINRGNYFLLKTPVDNYAIDVENIDYFLDKLKELLSEELLFISDASQAVKFSNTSINLKSIQIQSCLLKLLTEHYKLPSLNLLQGNYKPELKNDWQKIKWVSISLFTALMIATGFQGYKHWQLTQKEAELDQQREKIFKSNFPDAKRIVNPLAQMKNKLQTVKENQQQQGQFITLLAKASMALRDIIAQQKVHLQTLEFENNILVFKLSANSLDVINQIKQQMAQQQLKVEIISSDKVDNQFNASFKVSGSNE
jgi:general secretion pathway protein L